MDNSEEEMEEDENEWRKGSGLNKAPELLSENRVILHFDLDCFYAQVEMIRNPALRDVPLGVQQKYIVVTCNYVAREQGLTKLMSVTDAKEKCPQLVLVNGENLTHYREMSYKVTELLMSYSPLVERLGFDENFMDITEVVEKRLAQTDSNNVSFKGHVFNNLSADVKASEHPRLAVGSHIAAELRDIIHSKLGLTGCAGIASNKLLAKLVSGTFKPNQQTTLLPQNVSDIMDCLSSLRKVPGVGHQTAKRLHSLGLESVKSLQLFPLNNLVREFGGPMAQRLKNLAFGIDDSPVTTTGAPQSLSDEDSFKKISCTKDVLEKIQQLLNSLVERMHKDGRLPQTFRLTIRRFSATNKWFNRESRQCPIPKHIGQKVISGSCDDAVVQLVSLAMKLFHKMVDSSTTFHLTLINVCFSNLQNKGPASSGKGSITSFFTQSTLPRNPQPLSSQIQGDSSQYGGGHCMDHQCSTNSRTSQHSSQKTVTTKSCRSSGEALHGFRWRQSSVVAEEDNEKGSLSREKSVSDGANKTVTHKLPSNVDPEVFKLLPEDIQKELLSPAYISSFPSMSTNLSNAASAPYASQIAENEPPSIFTVSQSGKNIKEILNRSESTSTHHQQPAGACPAENVKEERKEMFPQPADCKFPGNVDPTVFSELPPDVQTELMCEWKQQKIVVKHPFTKKPGRSFLTKEQKAAGKSNQANSLLKYFKPS
ncbi:DNA polymerase iota isoform X2 [Betta splendens]|uniref:DNA polymerase iota isoform X2 n=1 Tax=Betta splendens TaxID=158456 RepID=A0A6P7NH14_BETSP|nr:DNA polymerase iota isoform X2 [Betta splendens]